MIVFSDLHLTPDSADTVFGQVLPGIHQACKEHNDYVVGFLGDWWHIRYKVDVKLQNQTADVLRGWNAEGITLHMLPGNHDQVDQAGSSALDIFQDLGNVTVHTEPGWSPDGLWIPYRKQPELIHKALQMSNPYKLTTVFMHQGVQGALMNDHRVDADGIELLTPKDWTVFSGHYHKHHTVGNVVYVGSPYQTKADESGQDKGYIRWDGRHWTFYPKDWGPKYYRVELCQGQALDLSSVKPGDDVRVKVDGGYDIQALGQELQKAGVRHTITREVAPVEARLGVGAGATLREYAEAYVKIHHGELDMDRLLKQYDTITGA